MRWEEGRKGYVQPKTPPRDQMRATAPAMPSALLAAMVVLVTSNGCPRVVTLSPSCKWCTSCSTKLPTHSNMLSPAPTVSYISLLHMSLLKKHSRSKLLNLTGFFSSAGGAPMPVAALILWDYLSIDAGPDQGKRVLRR